MNLTPVLLYDFLLGVNEDKPLLEPDISILASLSYYLQLSKSASLMRVKCPNRAGFAEFEYFTTL